MYNNRSLADSLFLFVLCLLCFVLYAGALVYKLEIRGVFYRPSRCDLL